MVVDDEPDVVFTIKKVLESDGFEVDAFYDSDLALKRFKGGLYDLLILDVRMPVMNGFELYAKLQDIDDKIKVIFMSALSDLEEYEMAGKEEDPRRRKRHFIQKPVGNKDLIERVNTLLSF
ncbi:response regulator with CheY-like receiver, AAA-type ATPase, and DNA-binding domains [Candidatus Nitrososphaera evergladensis SR1]|uniref:Response regulator with CheY-like receiver, AAA-type ATPase, and DNA-binding domains n=2 Tax=Nitrososphaera TaxID=497726 RepID=A0A075MW90_9ARCH|nr:response regulator with CheY-like receiver, AAA-type ATPase, and DNA-binding domains [Candidatus Nitrososphaera evergladensis SR1]